MFDSRWIAIILVIMFCASCVPNEKVVYLQGDQTEKTINSSQYKLQPGDIISIKVSSLTPDQYNLFDNDNNQNQNIDPVLNGFVINSKGEVKLPIAGGVVIKNLTIGEAEQVLQQELSVIYREATVSVKLLNYNFTVLGEVKSPGRFTVYLQRITLLEALAMAGDVTEFGDKSQIQITRFSEEHAHVYYVNVLSQDFIESEFFILRPGDVINVIPLKIKNTRRYQLPNIGLAISSLTALILIINSLNK